MATYNRPGVYIEEVATTPPIAGASTSSVATFMGQLARGPLEATLVSSWTQFTSVYGDVTANAADLDLPTAVYLFFANGGSQCYIQRVVVSMTASSTTATTASTSLTVAAYTSLITSDGGAAGTITAGMFITGTGIPAGTTVTVAGSTTLTLSKAASVPANTVLTIGTPVSSSVTIYGNTTAALNAQIPVTSTGIATSTPTGTTNITITTATAHGFSVGQSVTVAGITPTGYNGTWVTQAGTTASTLVIPIGSNPGAITVAGAVAPAGQTTVTYTTAAAHNLVVGQSVIIAGTTSTNAHNSPANSSFVVTSVPTTTTFSVVNPLAPVAPTTGAAGTVTAVNAARSELILTANNPGAWSNGLYYEISSTGTSGTYPGKYFNLAIYSGGTSAGFIVERFTDLTMLATDSSYAPTVINASSQYVTATDPNAANHTAALFTNSNTPLSTNLVAVSAINSALVSASPTVVLTTDPGISVGMYVYGSGVTNGTRVNTYVVSTKTVTLSASMTIPAGATLTFVNTPLTGGGDGTAVNNTAIASTASLARLDAVASPLLLNAPGVTEAANVNNMLNYAYNRGDCFVIIDPTAATTDSVSQLALANNYTGGAAGSAALGFGAVYYPNLTIPSLTSSASGAISTAYPGGAVAAKYVTTDVSRGVFKSPAGLETRLAGVVSVAKLTNSELDNLNNGSSSLTASTATPVNAIRYIPGSGIVVMGARTLSTAYNNKYVSVRRSLIQLRRQLTDATAFAIFEPNDQLLWNRVKTTCEANLINFWQAGGLRGTTPSDAFFVKCDSTLNTASSILAGEVRVEIGVALQRPAEFIVIRISQYDSGSVVTVL
jgi:phage tail sheath protein FI